MTSYLGQSETSLRALLDADRFHPAPQESGGADWLAPILHATVSQPWLVVGVVGVATVQALTFRRRATS